MGAMHTPLLGGRSWLLSSSSAPRGVRRERLHDVLDARILDVLARALDRAVEALARKQFQICPVCARAEVLDNLPRYTG
jgi:hypothetical protein